MGDLLQERNRDGSINAVETSSENPDADNDEPAAMHQLDEELDRMPEKLKGAWVEALHRCPQLVGYRHKLTFLRCERYHSKLAALRLVRYWSKRVELFGPEAAFLSLSTLEEGQSALQLRAVDMETLNLGFIQWTRQYDEEGRGIIWGHWTRIPPGYTRGRRNRLLRLPSVCRVLWFIIHAALDESENVQTKGVVIVSEDGGYGLRHVDVAQSVMMVQVMGGCLPIQVAAMHSCHSPVIFKWIMFPCCLRHLMRDILLDFPTTFHRGTGQRLLDQLAMNGLPRSCLPTELGGDVNLCYNEWLESKKSTAT